MVCGKWKGTHCSFLSRSRGEAVGDPIHSRWKRLRKWIWQEVGDNSGKGKLDRTQTEKQRESKNRHVCLWWNTLEMGRTVCYTLQICLKVNWRLETAPLWMSITLSWEYSESFKMEHKSFRGKIQDISGIIFGASVTLESLVPDWYALKNLFKT